MQYKVFISSTAADLDDHRTKVKEALERMEGVEPVWMKNWVSSSLSPGELCEEKIKPCQIFVGLIGHLFGSAPEGRERSYTMIEWDVAQELALPCLMHKAPEDCPPISPKLWKKQSQEQIELQGNFRDEDLQECHTGQPGAWINSDSLATHVAEAVRQEIVRLQKNNDTQDGSDQEDYTLELHKSLLYDERKRLRDRIQTARSNPEELREVTQTLKQIESDIQNPEISFEKQKQARKKSGRGIHARREFTEGWGESAVFRRLAAFEIEHRAKRLIPDRPVALNLVTLINDRVRT